MMNDLLISTLMVIKYERGKSFDESYELVDALLQEYGEKNLAERLYRDIPLQYSWEVVADLFSILMWTLNDNGASLTLVLNRWLEDGDDLRKIQIALNIDTYPYPDKGKMKSVLSKVAKSYPEVADRCHELMLSRN